jgi:hypothetical protein
MKKILSATTFYICLLLSQEQKKINTIIFSTKVNVIFLSLYNKINRSTGQCKFMLYSIYLFTFKKKHK